MSSFGQRPGPLDEAKMRAALGRLQGRFQQRTTTTGSLPAGMHPVTALNCLAELWGQPAGAPATDAGTPGPAGIVMAGARLGLDVTCESRDPRTLSPPDCPCIVMTPDGLSHLVGRIDAEGQALLVQPGGAQTQVDLKALSAGELQTVFRVTRQPGSGTTAQPAARHSAAVEAGANPASGLALSRIWASLRSQRRLVISLVLASALINLLGLTLPLFSMAVFDRVIPHAAFETLWALALGVTVALGVEMALRHARLKLTDAIAQGASLGTQSEAVARQLQARSSALPRQSGGLIQPIADIDSLANLTPALAVSLLADLPFFVVMMILIASIAGPVVLAPLLGTLGLIAIHALAHLMAHRASMEHGGLARRQHQLLIDTIAAQERIRVTGAAGLFLARYEQAADDSGYASHQIRYWHGLAAQTSAVLIQIVIIATVVIGVYQIGAAAMTLGALSACILLVNRSMTPVSIITGLVFRLLQTLKASEPMDKLLAATPESGGDERGAGHGRIEGHLEFAGVGFAHPGEERPALQAISFRMRPGERIALVGNSGCGKSTLLRLIPRLLEAGGGRIKLDERDIQHYDPALLRQVIGFMPQDNVLIDGSLQDNLILGLPQVDAAYFEQVCRMTGVHEIATRHPQGFSLQVGPGGQRLSAGERQCVALARTLMGRPGLLLLDEPTSAFDNAHEQKLVTELKKLPAEMGMIIATHRLALLNLVDRIIWIDQGRIVADGPRDEIFKRQGAAA